MGRRPRQASNERHPGPFDSELQGQVAGDRLMGHGGGDGQQRTEGRPAQPARSLTLAVREPDAVPEHRNMAIGFMDERFQAPQRVESGVAEEVVPEAPLHLF
jgi:hypothetical protein